jgi:threonylcarbamoyladenosine tRNA methylthiotransferase MtaB
VAEPARGTAKGSGTAPPGGVTAGGAGRVAFQTFGCKANQYDTERMRHELEARGWKAAGSLSSADLCVINTCTVTNQADAEARSFIRRARRRYPGMKLAVAGCSAALRPDDYRGMEGVVDVVQGHDPVAVAHAVEPIRPRLVQLGLGAGLDRIDHEPVGAELLTRNRGRTRGWLKIQDGCDRKCSFCATRLARGASRSRSVDEITAEARTLAMAHPELVLTGIHIGHYGLDLESPESLSRLVARLLDAVPDVRFRLGSIEATEVDDRLLDLMTASDGRLVPHLHMPLQSGADPVLRRMRRWHTREMYRVRALEIAERMAVDGAATTEAVPVLGLGADIITGFPGETEADHRDTVDLVEELPYTYLHVFPFSPREGTGAAELVREMPVPQRVAGERSRELRDIVQAKGEAYRRARTGSRARVVLEGDGRSALTEDYVRVSVKGPLPEDRERVHDVELEMVGGELSAVFTNGCPPPRIKHRDCRQSEGPAHPSH